MLSLAPSVRLFVATQPVDGRKGELGDSLKIPTEASAADSLMALVRDVLRQDPLSGQFVRLLLVYWDRNGFAMWTKRLEKGGFCPSLTACHRAQRGCIREPPAAPA